MIMKSKKYKRIVVLSIGLLVCVSLGYFVITRSTDSPAASDSGNLPISAQVIHSLRQQPNTSSDMAVTHLSSGLVPPTNKWFSGIVFGNAPQPIFPMPLAFKPSNDGFKFNLPLMSTTPNTIFGSFQPDIAGSIGGAHNYRVTRYDDLSIDITYVNDKQQDMSRLTLSEGSPFIYYQALRGHDLLLTSGSVETAGQDLYSLASASSSSYGMYMDPDSKNISVAGQKLGLPKNARVVFFGLPQGMDRHEMAQYAGARLAGVRTSHDVQDNAKTSFTYQTDGNKPTLYAAMPGKDVTGRAATNATFNSIYGPMPVYAGTTFSFEAPKVSPETNLDISSLSSAERGVLISELKKESQATQLNQPDSYNGGKELYRAANLYNLALQLQQTSIAAGLHEKLIKNFDEWFDPTGYQNRGDKYFYYDTATRGIVGVQPAFGSENFNDHNFHYGYYLYAAAIVAQHDKTFIDHHGTFVNLLVGDIANPETTKYFPIRRPYDPYTGHSWASGNGSFADGNNQESVSEAANAWNGVGAWAQTINNPGLKNQATWMLSNEMKSAHDYWLAPDKSQAIYQGFDHPFVALNWGGKRDFATFFSPEPTAALGIQLIPMNPAMRVLGQQDNDIIQTNLSAVGTSNDTHQFADYMLMYQALSGADRANLIQRAQNLDARYLDNANSRTYLLSWIMSSAKK